MRLGYIYIYVCITSHSWFSERAGAEIVECACVIEIPELKVFTSSN